MKQKYYIRDPNASHSGYVLTIEGLDPALFNQGSEIDNRNSNRTKNFDLNLLDDKDDQAIQQPQQPHKQQQPKQQPQLQYFQTISERQSVPPSNLINQLIN